MDIVSRWPPSGLQEVLGRANFTLLYFGYLRYRSRERNLLALPTLDMYLPLSKFESIQRVSIDATV